MTAKYNLIPLIGKAILKVEEPAEKTDKGIILPEPVRKSKNIGTVIAVHEIKNFHQNGSQVYTELRIGDQVVFNTNSTNEIELDGEKFLVVGQESIHTKIVKVSE